MIQVYLRGLSTKVTVANTCQLHQLAQNGCLCCGYYRNIKYNIPEVQSTQENRETRKSLLRMRNDKSACNLEPFHATLSKIENKNEHDTTSLSLQFQVPAVKSGGTDKDTSPVKGALTHPEGC